jgi:hypothetical protein
VDKKDSRALIFKDLVNGSNSDGEWTMKISGSLAGKSIKRGNDPHHKGHPGEQILLGEANEALKVRWDGNYIRMIDEIGYVGYYYLEVPRAQYRKEYAMWFRSLHSRNDNYFAWVNNGDGTISCWGEQNLVLGYGVPKNE